MIRNFFFTLTLAAAAIGQSKYTGPRPDKPDLPYLLHASSLVATETGEAREEKRKDDLANIINGAASPSKTPMAEPIFLIEASKLAVEKIQLYKMEVRGGQREVAFPTNPKKAKDGPRPLRLVYNKVDDALFRVEVNQPLDNGEYCLSPSGSQQVFCFQVY